MKSRWARSGVVCVALVATATGIAGFGALGGAQVDEPTAIEFEGADTAASVSDNGAIVVFESQTLDVLNDVASTRVVLHDRTDPEAPTTAAVVGAEGGRRPGVSGDGCIVAWSSPVSGTGSRLVTLDRCDEDAVAIDVVSVPEFTDAARLGSPSLSTDGSTIAVSTGDEVVVLDVVGGIYTRRDAVDGPPPVSAPRVTDDQVDVSDDGSVVVFASGVAPTEAEPDPLRTIHRFETGTVTEIIADASGPSLSGDATVMVAEQDGQIVAMTLPRGGAPTALGGGTRATLSNDGNHVVFETADTVEIRSWTDAGVAPFSRIDARTVTEAPSPTRSGARLDRFGSLIVTDVEPPVEITDPVADVVLRSVDSSAAFESASYDLGIGEVGAELRATVDVTNDGPASLGIGSLEADGDFLVDPDACGGSIRPGTTCSFDVSFVVEQTGSATGTLTITDPVPGASPITADLTALGVDDTGTTSTTTTTTASTTGGSSSTSTTSSTGGSTSTSSTTGGSSTTSSTSGSTSSTTGSTTSRPPATTTTTTTTLPPGSGMVISPGSFEFAPTIVDAGRRTGAIEVVNSAGADASVDSVVLIGDTSFVVDDDQCSGVSLAAGARCTIIVRFAPVDVGASVAELTITVEGGRELVATLSGAGAGAPFIEVVPTVAGGGQVVTVTGEGFPTGLTVELVIGTQRQQAPVDDLGRITAPVVIFPNTPDGPLEILVEGQTDLFADTSTTVLVRTPADRSNSGVLRGSSVNVGG